MKKKKKERKSAKERKKKKMQEERIGLAKEKETEVEKENDLCMYVFSPSPLASSFVPPPILKQGEKSRASSSIEEQMQEMD